MNKIDILIPVIEKDLEVLPHTIDSARKNIRHPIGEILIIAPENCEIKDLVSKKIADLSTKTQYYEVSKKQAKDRKPLY